MIIMTCGFCGCRDLIPANVHYETTCPDCLVQLSLWEVRMVQIESTPQLLVTEELEAIGLNLAQLDEK